VSTTEDKLFQFENVPFASEQNAGHRPENFVFRQLKSPEPFTTLPLCIQGRFHGGAQPPLVRFRSHQHANEKYRGKLTKILEPKHLDSDRTVTQWRLFRHTGGISRKTDLKEICASLPEHFEELRLLYQIFFKFAYHHCVSGTRVF